MTSIAQNLRAQWVRSKVCPNSAFPWLGQTKLLLWLCAVSILCCLVVLSPPAYAQDDASNGAVEGVELSSEPDILVPVRTENPRRTLVSFVRLRDRLEDALAAYQQDKSREAGAAAVVLLDELAHLIDLSDLPRATARETGIDTVGHLLDVLGRVPLPNPGEIPLAQDVNGDPVILFRIPSTPLLITLMTDGPREGEFLFNAQTVRSAPRFYQAVREWPLKSDLDISSWSNTLPQLTGWAIPAAVDASIPTFAKQLFLGTPSWKVVAILITLGLGSVAYVIWHRLVHAASKRAKLYRHFVRLLAPLGALPLIRGVSTFARTQINVGGEFANILDATLTGVYYIALTFLFWRVLIALSETALMSPRIPDKSLNSNLVRLLARITGVFGAIVILSLGAQQIGVPVFSILAGLGVGGLAIALALRPTLENLIGGIILYLDKPVRVGDFCSFSGTLGIVEDIGVRSTQIRALDRTLISIPNSKFADMELINWARCDEMMMLTTIALRYETDTDQLRFVLMKLREMAHAHPKVNSSTVRIRMVGYGSSSLDIEIRLYLKTREWNEFYAFREDVLLRTKTIVEDSGTNFAFPSMTLYAGSDRGLDATSSAQSASSIQALRRRGELPFPQFSEQRLEELHDTLDYPPVGSPHHHGAPNALDDGPRESLSSDPDDDRVADIGHEDPDDAKDTEPKT